MFISTSSNKNELNLLVDVGSSSVGAALVFNSESGAQNVISSARNSISFQSELNFDRFFDLMINTFEKSVNQILRSMSKRPDNVYCFLASPWYASQIRTIKVERERDFEFTKEILNGLVAKDLEEFEKSHISKLRNSSASVTFIENKIINVKVNGYRPNDPFGKISRNAEISLFLSVAPEKVVNSIKSKLAKIIPESNIIFHTFLLPFFAVVRDLFLDTPDFLLIDVGGEVTDVSVTRGGILSGAISFPLGKNFLIRSAGEVLKKDPEEAESLIKTFISEKLEDDMKKVVETALIPARTLWLKSFHDSLDKVTNELSLPSKIFLTVDGDIEKWFVKAIEGEEYSQYTLTSEKFSIIVVDIMAFEKYLSFNDTIEERDQFLSLEALFTKLQSIK